MRRFYLIVFALLSAFGFQLVNANVAGAITDLGWVEDYYGSVHCTRDSNHVVCESYPANSQAHATVIDDWLSLGCPYTSVSLTAGWYAHSPAYLYYPFRCYPYKADGTGFAVGYVNSGYLWGSIGSAHGSFSHPNSATGGHVYVDPDQASSNLATGNWIYGVY